MKKYHSKFGWEILMFLLILGALTCLPGILREGISMGFYVLIFIWLSVIGFYLWISFRVVYIIDGEILIIKSPPFYENIIDINNVISVGNTKVLLSSPAPSFDRIELKYGKTGSVIVSPQHKKEFVEHLKRINPKIIDDL